MSQTPPSTGPHKRNTRGVLSLPRCRGNANLERAASTLQFIIQYTARLGVTCPNTQIGPAMQTGRGALVRLGGGPERHTLLRTAAPPRQPQERPLRAPVLDPHTRAPAAAAWAAARQAPQELARRARLPPRMTPGPAPALAARGAPGGAAPTRAAPRRPAAPRRGAAPQRLPRCEPAS
jgi:hypothetical protein